MMTNFKLDDDKKKLIVEVLAMRRHNKLRAIFESYGNNFPAWEDLSEAAQDKQRSRIMDDLDEFIPEIYQAIESHVVNELVEWADKTESYHIDDVVFSYFQNKIGKLDNLK